MQFPSYLYKKDVVKKPEHPDPRFGLGDNTISFVLTQNNIPKNIDSNQNFQTLFLLDTSYQIDIFQFLPRIFTISTRNGTSYFNYEMICEASRTILEELEYDPTKFEYHLDIADEENVLEKFSQLFQGKKVKFNEDNLPTTYKIVRTLKISKCPNFLKPYNLRTENKPEKPKSFGFFNSTQNKENQENVTEKEVVICQADFNCFVIQNSFKNFTIITKKKEYKCRLYAVYSSNVIGEFLKKNPEATSYQYDIEDEFEEFENINKIFNFERVNITSDNVNILDNMIRELEITCLYEMIDNFQNKYDQTNAEINIEQTKIDEIEEIISILHNINETNFDEIGEKINKYIMNKNESEIQEFCSFLIQFIKTEDNIKKQELVLEILINIDKETCKNESIKYLMSQLIKQLLFELGITKSTCSFAYLLYKKGKISKNKLFDSIRQNYNIIKKEYYSYFIPYEFSTNKENNVAIYFLPELKEIQVKVIEKKQGFGRKFENKLLFDIFYKDEESGYNNDKFFNYLFNFFHTKLDVYKQLRDNGEPHDELTKALRRDDVDKLQQILTMSKISQPEKKKIPYNIFEEYIENGETSYINYSAAYGSIKCFKYLLLNNHQIDDKTFKYSIYGGNIEIVKIVDQQNPKKGNFYDLIVPTIIKHQNELFDWLFEQKFAIEITKSDTKLLHSLMKCSVKNGNIHALIEIVDKGYDLASSFEEMIDYAAANGFYTIAQLIYNTVPKKQHNLSLHKKSIGEGYGNSDYYERNKLFLPCASFGNSSILNLYIDHFDDYNLMLVYKYAVNNEYLSIIKFIDNLPKGNILKFQKNNFLFFDCLLISLNFESDEIFDYLLSTFTNSNGKLTRYIHKLDSILNNAIELKKSDHSKKIIKIILSLDQEINFSNAYIQSLLLNLTDVCQFFLDNKAFINYKTVLSNFDKICTVDEKTFNLFINNIPPSIAKQFTGVNLLNAIENKNIYLIKYLLDQNVKSDYALIEAVKTNDIKIFELVLKYFDPKFINESTQEGTALTIAAAESNLEIVKQLLTIEGIDANLTNSKNQTALNIAIMKQEEEISNIILDFYGENIKYQVSQLNESIKIILKSASPSPSTSTSSSHSKSPKSFGFGARPNESQKSFGFGARPNESQQSFGFGARPNESQQSFGFGARPNESQNSFGFSNNQKTNESTFGNEMFQTNQNKKLYHKMIPILKRILEVENVDLNCVEGNHSILSFACKYDEQNLVEYLLKTNKVNVNLKDPNEGNTALIVSISNSNYDIAKLLLEYESTDFNIRNYKEETALTISVEKENEEIINKIINSNKFDAAKSRLNYAFYISNPKISKLLISTKTLDVNYLYKKSSFSNNESNEKVLPFSTKLIDISKNRKKDSTIIELIDLIVNHQSFDKEKSLAKIALFNSTSLNCDIEIFKKLLSIFENDVNILSINNQSLLVSAAKNKNEEVVHFLLKDPNFDCNKNEILYAYVLSARTPIIKKELSDYVNEYSQSIDFNRVMPDGKTPPIIILGRKD